MLPLSLFMAAALTPGNFNNDLTAGNLTNTLAALAARAGNPAFLAADRAVIAGALPFPAVQAQFEAALANEKLAAVAVINPALADLFRVNRLKNFVATGQFQVAPTSVVDYLDALPDDVAALIKQAIKQAADEARLDEAEKTPGNVEGFNALIDQRIASLNGTKFSDIVAAQTNAGNQLGAVTVTAEIAALNGLLGAPVVTQNATFAEISFAVQQGIPGLVAIPANVTAVKASLENLKKIYDDYIQAKTDELNAKKKVASEDEVSGEDEGDKDSEDGEGDDLPEAPSAPEAPAPAKPKEAPTAYVYPRVAPVGQRGEV
jgi:hypothetical protein